MSDMPRVIHEKFLRKMTAHWADLSGSHKQTYTRDDLVDKLIKLVEDTFESESDFIPEWDLACKAAIAAIQGEGE